MNTAHSGRKIHGNTLLTKGISSLPRTRRLIDVVFRVLHFAFAAYLASHNGYVRVIN
jgi:hypothetical protein